MLLLFANNHKAWLHEEKVNHGELCGLSMKVARGGRNPSWTGSRWIRSLFWRRAQESC
jgi:hypothetical protein